METRKDYMEEKISTTSYHSTISTFPHSTSYCIKKNQRKMKGSTKHTQDISLKHFGIIILPAQLERDKEKAAQLV